MAVASRLDALIATNVVVPLRSSFHAASSNQQTGEDSFSITSKAIIEAFKAPCVPYLSKLKWKTETHMTAKLLSLLFEISITSHSRGTPKARRVESPFLGRLLTELKISAEAALQPNFTSGGRKAYSRAVTWLLERAVDHNVHLDLSNLEHILDDCSGLFSTPDKQSIEWKLISLCLRNNADVFVVPSPHGAMKTKYSYRAPNKYLSALLTTLSTYSSGLDERESYNMQLTDIVLPLLRSFADARDLTGFLDHWREQLDESHNQRKSDTTHATHQVVWEDDNLVHAALELIEFSLSASEIDGTLVKIGSELSSLDPERTEPFNISTLVILDCVSAGCRSDELLARLSGRARNMYDALAKATLDPESYGGHRWRLWRILATINWKLPAYDDGSSSMEVHQAVARKAFDVLDAPAPMKAIDHDPTYQEKSHAFGFLTSLILSDPGILGTNLVSEAVGKVLDLKEFFCRQLDGDKYGVMKPLEEPKNWNGKGAEIQSLDTLYVSCLAQLLSSPSTYR